MTRLAGLREVQDVPASWGRFPGLSDEIVLQVLSSRVAVSFPLETLAGCASLILIPEVRVFSF